MRYISPSKEILSTGDLVDDEGDVLPSYTGENGPRNSHGTPLEELEISDETVDEVYDGDIPQEYLPKDSLGYKIWEATEAAKMRIIQAGSVVVQGVAELPSDDASEMWAPVTNSHPSARPASRPHSKGETQAMRNARDHVRKAREDRWGKG
jgi:hypothetical protein